MCQNSSVPNTVIVIDLQTQRKKRSVQPYINVSNVTMIALEIFQNQTGVTSIRW